MPIFPLIVASLIVVPQPNLRMAEKMQKAYPTIAIREGISGAAYVRYWVNPEGKAYRCEILDTLGSEIFGTTACDPRRKFRFVEPKTPDGEPSYGMITTLVKFSLNDSGGNVVSKLPEMPNVLLPVTSEVAGEAATDFKIAAAVQADGVVSHCEALEDAPVELADLACSKIIDRKISAGTDADGNPIPYVASLRVRPVSGDGESRP